MEQIFEYKGRTVKITDRECALGRVRIEIDGFLCAFSTEDQAKAKAKKLVNAKREDRTYFIISTGDSMDIIGPGSPPKREPL